MESKPAYAYHPETGEYLGEVNAWRSPLPDEEGKKDFLLPANATFKAPPKVEDGKIRVFNPETDKWSHVKAPAPQAEEKPRTPEQLAGLLRWQRNQLLAASDWTQLQDVSEKVQGNGTAWREYRQALRDVPQQKGFPEDFEVWPTQPE